MDTKHLRPFLLCFAPTSTVTLLFALLIAVSAPVAKADGCIGTTCITAQTNYDGFEDALRHPNATGQASFKGFEGFKSNDTQGEDDEWTWTAKVLDFRIPGTDQSTLTQSYDLDIPMNFDIRGPELARNMCTTVFGTKRVSDIHLDADSGKQSGDCGDAFSDEELDGIDMAARNAVGDDDLPCSALLTQASYEAWLSSGRVRQTNVTAGHFSPDSNQTADRNSTTATRYLFSTEEHDADDTTAFETAIKEVQPIFMLSYPAEWNVSMSTNNEDLIQSRMVCIYVTDVPEGYSSRAATFVVKPLLTALWSLVVVRVAAFLFR